LSLIAKPSRVFRGTKVAQSLHRDIEIKQQFVISGEAHNLKAAGSNPAPATNPNTPHPAIGAGLGARCRIVPGLALRLIRLG